MSLSSIWDLWNNWNIRSFVILSLSLQIFLILFAPLRKKIANRLLDFLLWLSYLMADWVATFGVGLISHNRGNSPTHAVEVDGALKAFWASFLLLHLGGPDTITAFSLEDSFLWRRHLLNFVFQVCAAIYVFVHIFPNNNSLVVPTILIFFAGVIKGAERTLALYLSSLASLKERMDPQWQAPRYQLEESVKELENKWNKYSDGKEAYLAEHLLVRHAYKFFRINKVFLGDLIFTSVQCEMSRIYFHKVSAVDALRVISIELQFMYEKLYTKAPVIRSKWSYIFRFISFTNIVVALVMFNHLKKHPLHKLDVKITDSLLFGGIVLDVIALFMLISSDWIVARIMGRNPRSSTLNSIFHMVLSTVDHLRKPRFTPCEAEPNASVAYEMLDTPFIFERWSESISACNLLSISLKEGPRKIYKRNRGWGIIALSKICSFPLKIINLILLVEEAIAKACAHDKIYPRLLNTKFMSKNPFIKELWVFIFDEVKRKSKKLDNLEEVREIFEARGDMFLKSGLEGINCNNLLVYVTELNYDDGIIIWHIATEIWYNKEKQAVGDGKREFSKILSDYMLYLMLHQFNVMSAVASFAHITLWDILDEILSDPETHNISLEMLCMRLWEAKPLKHSLGVGIRLAQQMGSLGERKWEVMSGVWVEMLSYAAVHIKGEAHVQVLSKGGELLAFVWLLMVHFGCFYKAEWGRHWGERDEIFEKLLQDAE
ncbi:hypothetical protein ACJRO7_000273 [Eucalyptus globulus]|uniref:DUF4220 domain-containing protein n=1 Tax=Eucalyptus globulus TaxID=34317 RepID=A0ABD3LM28_EUCGL